MHALRRVVDPVFGEVCITMMVRSDDDDDESVDDDDCDADADVSDDIIEEEGDANGNDGMNFDVAFPPILPPLPPPISSWSTSAKISTDDEEDDDGDEIDIVGGKRFGKGDRDKSGGQLEPDEDEWLEITDYFFNGQYLDEEQTIELLGYDWDVLENKIQIKFYE